MQPRVDLRPGDVGALAVHPLEHAAVDEIRDRLADGHPAHPEPLDERSLGGNGVARTQLVVDELLEDAANLRALGGGGAQTAIHPETSLSANRWSTRAPPDETSKTSADQYGGASADARHQFESRPSAGPSGTWRWRRPRRR